MSEVVEWVKYALSYIDPYANVLGIELFLERTIRPDDGTVPIALGVVVDLLLLRTDRDGNRFIEVIDYKTGKYREDSTFAPVVSRFALKQLIKAQFPNIDFATVLFTELYLASRMPRTQELTLPTCLAGWEQILTTVSAIEAETEWNPTPSPLCHWCPFNRNGCDPDTFADRELF